MQNSPQADRGPRLWPYLILPAIFLLLVAAGPLYSWWADVAHGDAPDANIGYGLGFMWTAFLGLPWSLWPWYFPPEKDSAEMLAYVGCALINLVGLTGLKIRAWRHAVQASRPYSAKARS